jgi:hypothetical protein
MIIGNLSRPPMDRNEDYLNFIGRACNTTETISEYSKWYIYIAGDFNIDLLKFKEAIFLGIHRNTFHYLCLPINHLSNTNNIT